MKRKLFGIQLSLILALVLVACAAPAPTPTPTKAPAPTAAPKVAEPTKPPAPVAAAPTVPPGQKELVIQMLGGSFEPPYKAAIAAFEKQYGAKVTYSVGIHSEANFAKVLAQKDKPEISVVMVNNITLVQGKTGGLLAKYDKARIPNLKDIYDELKLPDETAVPGNIWLTGIVYNTKIFKEKGFPTPTSWYDLWKPEYKGRVAIHTVGSALMYQWLPEIARLETGSPKNIDAAFAKFKELVPNLLTIAATSAQFDDLLKQEELWIGWQSLARVAIIKGQGVPVEFVYPKEGSPGGLNYYAVVKNAPNYELANEFINWVSRPEVHEAVAKAASLGPTNKNAKLDPDVATRVPYGLEAVKKVLMPDAPFIMDNLAAWVERWNKEIERK